MTIPLAARLDVDDLLVLAERGDRSDRQLHEVKTIGGAEVARLVTRLLRREPPKADDLKRLREARNGVAHLGQGDDRVEVRDLLAAGIGYINDLLPELDREPGAFWGRYESLAVNLVNEAVKELELRYQLKLERAQEIFRQRVGNLKEPQRSAQIQALSEVPVVTRYFLVSPTTCPACESPAFVRGREFDYGLGVTGFSPRVFGCRVCDLELQGKELSLAGFETEVDQPPDYDPEWEPDEDWNLGGQDYGS